MIPAIIKRCVEAQDAGKDEIVLWGTGEPTREFLHVDDAAEGSSSRWSAWRNRNRSTSGPRPRSRSTILPNRSLASPASRSLRLGSFEPDGQPRRAVDGSKAQRLLGWSPRMGLEEGLKGTIEWYREHRS